MEGKDEWTLGCWGALRDDRRAVGTAEAGARQQSWRWLLQWGVREGEALGGFGQDLLLG